MTAVQTQKQGSPKVQPQPAKKSPQLAAQIAPPAAEDDDD